MLSRIKWDDNAEAPVAALQTVITEKPAGAEQRDEFPEEWAQGEAWDDAGDYIILGDELYSLIRPHTKAASYPRLLLPDSRCQAVIQEAHEELGHRSWLQTLRYLQASTVWPEMLSDVKQFLRCPHCQVNRPRPRATQLQITETPTRPFQKVGVDVTGPFPMTREGYR